MINCNCSDNFLFDYEPKGLQFSLKKCKENRRYDHIPFDVNAIGNIFYIIPLYISSIEIYTLYISAIEIYALYISSINICYGCTITSPIRNEWPIDIYQLPSGGGGGKQIMASK